MRVPMEACDALAATHDKATEKIARQAKTVAELNAALLSKKAELIEIKKNVTSRQTEVGRTGANLQRWCADCDAARKAMLDAKYALNRVHVNRRAVDDSKVHSFF